MIKGIGVFVLGCAFLLSFVFALEVRVVDSTIEQGDDIKFLATVDNSGGDKQGVWAYIWDNTGGLIWSGLMSLIGGGNTVGESWGVNVSSNSPPFPDVVGEESFTYTVSVNDSSGGVIEKVGSFVLRDGDYGSNSIQLRKGWNMIAFSFDSEDVGDKVISLNRGWNLIGYSSSELPSSNVKVSASIDDVVHRKASYYDSDLGSYKLMSLEDGDFDSNRGYWVYASSKGVVDMVIEGVGGAKVGLSKPVSGLIFRNEAGEELGYEDARPQWGIQLKRYNSGTNTFSFVLDNINSWEGYFVNSPNGNVVIIE